MCPYRLIYKKLNNPFCIFLNTSDYMFYHACKKYPVTKCAHNFLCNFVLLKRFAIVQIILVGHSYNKI